MFKKQRNQNIPTVCICYLFLHVSVYVRVHIAGGYLMPRENFACSESFAVFWKPASHLNSLDLDFKAFKPPAWFVILLRSDQFHQKFKTVLGGSLHLTSLFRSGSLSAPSRQCLNRR